MEHDVFISYSPKNKTTADKVCYALEQNDLKCWIAPRNITSGKNYSQEIDEGIESAKSVVLVYSHYSIESVYVQNEINTAFYNNKPIISFMIDDIVPENDTEYYLKISQWLPAYPNPDDELETLVKDTCKLCNEIIDEQMIVVDLTKFKQEDLSKHKKDSPSLALLAIPVLYWASFIYMGIVARKNHWTAISVAYFIPVILFALAYLQILPDFMTFLAILLICWIVAIIHGLRIRNEFLTRKAVLRFTQDDDMFEYLYDEYEKL